MIPTLAISTGEPAGIGLDLAVLASRENYAARLVILGDPEAVNQRARALGIEPNLPTYEADSDSQETGAWLCPVPAASPVTPGKLDQRNSDCVLRILDRAIDGCTSGEFNGMVTGPLQKSIIADTGIPFTGHTEYLAEKTGTAKVVMMLACEKMKVALATTHIPLAQVPCAITRRGLEETIRIVQADMRSRFAISEPRIAVCGLNPHAGENGHLGTEEQEVISPVIEKLLAEGMALRGPLPADTAFTEKVLGEADVVLAMYHDQGLPVLKYAGFGNAVNITLGLPFIRTSVDHGTALDLAGTGKINFGSMHQAISMAIDMATGK